MLNRIEGAASFLDNVQVLLLVAQHRFLACQFFLGCFDRSLKIREFFPGVADSLICCEQFPLGRACEALSICPSLFDELAGRSGSNP